MVVKRAKTDVINLKLRIREVLRGKLAASAKRHGVSLNTEISNRLEASLRGDRYDVLSQQIQLMRDQVNALAETPLTLRTAAQKQKEQK